MKHEIVRIIENDKGFTVEVIKLSNNPFKKRKWIPFTHYRGMPCEPYYYKTKEGAIKGAELKIKEMLQMFH